MAVQHVEGCATLSGLGQFGRAVEGTDRLGIYRARLKGGHLLEARYWEGRMAYVQ